MTDEQFKAFVEWREAEGLPGGPYDNPIELAAFLTGYAAAVKALLGPDAPHPDACEGIYVKASSCESVRLASPH